MFKIFDIEINIYFRIPTLKAHMRIHNDPYKCPECSKIFETGQKYREHMNTHTGTVIIIIVCGCDRKEDLYSDKETI